MSTTLRGIALSMLENLRNGPPEEIKESFPDITPEDAARIQNGLTAILTAGTEAERHRLEGEYKALYTELRKKYRKSGE